MALLLSLLCLAASLHTSRSASQPQGTSSLSHPSPVLLPLRLPVEAAKLTAAQGSLRSTGLLTRPRNPAKQAQQEKETRPLEQTRGSTDASARTKAAGSGPPKEDEDEEPEDAPLGKQAKSAMLRTSTADLALRGMVAEANEASAKGRVRPNIGSFVLRNDPAPKTQEKRKEASKMLLQSANQQVSGKEASRELPKPVSASASNHPTHERHPVAWTPSEDKYLVLFCAFGRMSNQVACLKKSLRLATVLNRTLLIPPTTILMFHGHVQEVWPLDMVVDFDRMVKCLKPAYGPNTVMSFDQYFAKHKVTTVKLDRFRCAATGSPHNCAHPLRIEAVSKALGPLIHFPPLEDYPKWLEPSKLPEGKTSTEAEIVSALGGVKDQLLCVGEMFGMMYDSPGTDFFGAMTRSADCNNLWRPNESITRLIEGITAKKLKTKNYAAMHLRRGDFYLESVLAKRKNLVKSGYFHYSPIVDVAKIVATQLKEAKIKTLYVATDASALEFQLFKSVLKDMCPVGKILSLKDVRGNPAWLAKQKWAQGALQLANGSATGIPWVLTEKGISARARVFLGTKSSTFSTDIADIRCDETRLQGPDSNSLICSTTGCEQYTC